MELNWTQTQCVLRGKQRNIWFVISHMQTKGSISTFRLVVSAQMYFLFLNLEAVRAVGIPFKSALKRLVKQCVCVYLPLSPQTGCWAGFHLWTQCSTQTLVWSSVSPGKQWCSPHASASVDDGWSPSRNRVASWGCTFCSCRLLTENDEKKSQSQCWGW